MRKRVFLRGPVQGTCTPGSVRGASCNWRPYRDGLKTNGADYFQELVGEDLSGVSFVGDYIQLQFNSPTLNVYTRVTITSVGRSVRTGDLDFAKALIGQINKYLVAVHFNRDSSLEIRPTDGSIISASLHPEDYVGSEAIKLYLCDGRSLRGVKSHKHPPRSCWLDADKGSADRRNYLGGRHASQAQKDRKG